MPSADTERVMLKNPNTGRDDLRIRRSIYEPVRRAIIGAIGDAGELPNSQLRDEVLERTDPDLWIDHSVGWYTTSVKLDLEARGLLRKHSSPQRLTLTGAGLGVSTELG